MTSRNAATSCVFESLRSVEPIFDVMAPRRSSILSDLPRNDEPLPPEPQLNLNAAASEGDVSLPELVYAKFALGAKDVDPVEDEDRLVSIEEIREGLTEE